MAERATSKRRNIMREFTIKELSGVDRPAQTPARAVLMKRADDVDADVQKDYYPQAVAAEVQAIDFATVLAEDEAREAAQEVGDDLREKWCALQRAFCTIAGDESVSAADKITMMQESLQQYIDSLTEQSDTIAESMNKTLAAAPLLAKLLNKDGNGEGDTPMTDAEKKQLAELSKTVDALKSQLAAATDKEPAKKAADLQAKLDAAAAEKAELEKKLEAEKAEKAELATKAGMSDGEKTYLAGLSGADKMKFMQASPEDRKKMMSKALEKAADENPEVYKAADGTVFRKNDDPRLVAMAKRADESEKRAAEEATKREDAELTKRAEGELFKNFAGEVKDKVEVLRGISKMADGPRAALEKMLETGGKAISAAFTRIGHDREQVAKTGSDFEKRVADIAARDKISKHAAMQKARAEAPAEFEAYQAAGQAN